MRVALDLTGLQPRPTGVDTYMTELVLALGEEDPAGDYVVFVPRGERHRFSGLPPGFRIVTGSLRARATRLGFQQAALPAAAAAMRADVVHSPGIHMPLVRGKAGHVVTIHDLTPLSMPQRHSRLRGSTPYRRMLRASMRRADLVVVSTRFVERDIRSRLPGVKAARIRRIPFGVSERFTPEAAENSRRVAERNGLRRPYLLAVGTLEPRKNLVGLLGAFRRLLVRGVVQEDLVIAGGPGWRAAGLRRALSDPLLAGRVRLLGYVPDRDLPALYAGARAFAYPSFEEGFGFPPLEAMACGVPTLSSRNSALAENLSEAAELVDPESEASIADALAVILRDERRRAELRDAGLRRAREFRWAECARRHRDVYRQLAAA